VIYSDEWRMACELYDVDASEGLIDALVERGTVIRREDGWAFEEPSLVDALIAYVKQAESWKGHHFTCANALFIAAPQHRWGVARRRVAHLIEASHFEEALEPLLQAQEEAYGDGEFDASRGFLDTRERLLDELDAATDDPRRAQNDWRRAQLLQVQGERAEALSLANRSRRLLKCTDWASERGHAALLHGQMLRDEGRFDDARRSFDNASRHYGSSGDNSGLAASRANLGFLELEFGQPERARDYFNDALRVFEQIGDSFKVSSMWCQKAHAWLMQGEREESRRCAERACQIARDAGHKPAEASAWTALGEVARSRSDWQEARACYGKAIELFEATNDRNVHIVRYNLALVELGAGEYDTARALLEEAKARFSELGFGPRAPLVNAGLMACCAAEADWDGFEQFYHLASQSVGNLGLGDTDLIWMAEKAAALAADHGHADAQEMARELARIHAQA
jgi:tetratricopeptide (TPR) repeat protein